MIKIGINGFGRIGRNIFRASLASGACQVVAVNDLTDARTLAHLLKYDSVHGILDRDIEAGDTYFTVDGRKVDVLSVPDPAAIPWKKYGAGVVVESSGRFASREGAAKHLGQVEKVVVSAPAKGADITVVMGVNHKNYDKSAHHIISCASCTTNCLAPLVKVLHDNFKVVKGTMTTVHSYTNDQEILDLPHKDLRRARAAGMSIIPTTTGAARAVGLVLPELDGKLNGLSLRVPTPNVSVVDFVAQVERETCVEEVNDFLRRAAREEMRGILAFSDLPLVSRDYNHSSFSSVVDGLSTMVVDKNMVKALSWYDNEWGYSNRVLDVISYMAGR